MPKKKVTEKKKRPKGVVTENPAKEILKEPRNPDCFGDIDNCPTGVCPDSNIKKQCKKETARRNKEEKNKNKKKSKVVRDERIKHRFQMIGRFLYSLLRVGTWVKLIQTFDDLLTVIAINLMMFIILACMGFSIYFIYKGNWRMPLVCAVVFVAVGYILEKMDRNNRVQSEGE